MCLKTDIYKTGFKWGIVMNGKVIITINGTHGDMREDSIETMQQGRCRFIGGKHVCTYNEIAETGDGTFAETITNLLKVGDDFVSLTKRGTTSTEMFFKKGTQHTGIYETPFGSLQMSIFTNHLSIQEETGAIDIEIEYGLEMNYSHISDSKIHIQIRSVE